MRSTAAFALAFAVQAAAQNATAVSTTVFNNIIKYTAYAAASYADSCGTPPNGASVVSYIDNASTDTQATLFKNILSREILLAFRGTSAPVDANTDFAFGLAPLSIAGTNCATCQVHGGFQNAYLSVQSTVLSSVKSAMAANPGFSLIVTGHSLGGALASLATSHLVANGVTPTAVYTYGEPRNGNPDFTTYIQSQYPPANYYRVTHSNDGVPHIPPVFFGYEHHGTEYWESLNTTNSASSTFLCPGVEPAACNAATSYGDNAIDGAHISYSNQLIGNALRVTQCGQGKVY